MSDGTSIYLASLKLADPIGAFTQGANLSAKLDSIRSQAQQQSFQNTMQGIEMGQRQRQLAIQNQQREEELQLRRDQMASQARLSQARLGQQAAANRLRYGSGASYTPAGISGATMQSGTPEGAPDLGPDRSQLGNDVNFMSSPAPSSIMEPVVGPPTPGEAAVSAAGDVGATDLAQGVNLMSSRPPDVGAPADRNQPGPQMQTPSILQPLRVADGRGNVTEYAEEGGQKIQRHVNERTGSTTNWSAVPGGKAGADNGLPQGFKLRPDGKVEGNNKIWDQSGVTASGRVHLKSDDGENLKYMTTEEKDREIALREQLGQTARATQKDKDHWTVSYSTTKDPKEGSPAAWGKNFTGKPKEVFYTLLEQVASPSERAIAAAIGNAPTDKTGSAYPVNLTPEQAAVPEYKTAWEKAWNGTLSRLTDADREEGFKKAREGYAGQVAERLNMVNAGSAKWKPLKAEDVLAKIKGFKEVAVQDNFEASLATPDEMFSEDVLNAPFTSEQLGMPEPTQTLFPTDGSGNPTAAAPKPSTAASFIDRALGPRQ